MRREWNHKSTASALYDLFGNAALFCNHVSEDTRYIHILVLGNVSEKTPKRGYSVKSVCNIEELLLKKPAATKYSGVCTSLPLNSQEPETHMAAVSASGSTHTLAPVSSEKREEEEEEEEEAAS
jgi:hypothetical protein